MAQHWSVHKAGRLGSTYATLSHADDLSQELTNHASFYTTLIARHKTSRYESEVKIKIKTKPELVWPVVFFRALGAMEPKEKTLQIHHQRNC